MIYNGIIYYLYAQAGHKKIKYIYDVLITS